MINREPRKKPLPYSVQKGNLRIERKGHSTILVTNRLTGEGANLKVNKDRTDFDVVARRSPGKEFILEDYIPVKNRNLVVDAAELEWDISRRPHSE